MQVTNKTSDMDQIKVVLYKQGDKVDWVPVGAGVFIVKKNDTVNWTPPKGEELSEYHMKVFKPGLIDGFLVAADVELGDNVTVQGGGGTYTIERP